MERRGLKFIEKPLKLDSLQYNKKEMIYKNSILVFWTFSMILKNKHQNLIFYLLYPMFGLGKDLDRNWMFSRAVGRSKNPGGPIYSGPPERMRTWGLVLTMFSVSWSIFLLQSKIDLQNLLKSIFITHNAMVQNFRNVAHALVLQIIYSYRLFRYEREL